MSKNSKDVQKRADSKREESRGVNLIAVFFLEDLPEDWQELVNSLHVKWIESPVHDKDFDANGTPKKIHKHGLFMFSSKTSLTILLWNNVVITYLLSIFSISLYSFIGFNINIFKMKIFN